MRSAVCLHDRDVFAGHTLDRRAYQIVVHVYPEVVETENSLLQLTHINFFARDVKSLSFSVFELHHRTLADEALYLNHIAYAVTVKSGEIRYNDLIELSGFKF